MTKIEFLTMVTNVAKRIVKDEGGFTAFAEGAVRDRHMNNWKGEAEDVDPELAAAIIVFFINRLGIYQGVDYALYTRDLREEETDQDRTEEAEAPGEPS
jgi:hypothetical protein